MIRTYKGVPLLGMNASSGTGKTTLLTKIIPILKAQEIQTACIKNSHHRLDLDTPGKDSYRLKEAGVDQMLLSNATNWALFGNTRESEANLETLLERLDWKALDIILIEGFRNAPIPHIVLCRTELNADTSASLTKETTIAIAGKDGLGYLPAIPYLDLDDPTEVATFIINRVLKYRLEE